jgi:hypothetical protein
MNFEDDQRAVPGRQPAAPQAGAGPTEQGIALAKTLYTQVAPPESKQTYFGLFVTGIPEAGRPVVNPNAPNILAFFGIPDQFATSRLRDGSLTREEFVAMATEVGAAVSKNPTYAKQWPVTDEIALEMRDTFKTLEGLGIKLDDAAKRSLEQYEAAERAGVTLYIQKNAPEALIKGAASAAPVIEQRMAGAVVDNGMASEAQSMFKRTLPGMNN